MCMSSHVLSDVMHYIYIYTYTCVYTYVYIYMPLRAIPFLSEGDLLLKTGKPRHCYLANGTIASVNQNTFPYIVLELAFCGLLFTKKCSVGGCATSGKRDSPDLAHAITITGIASVRRWHFWQILVLVGRTRPFWYVYDKTISPKVFSLTVT